MASITFNPILTTTASGFFSVQSDGMVQGALMDDPVTHFAIATGIVATTETLPMIGGCAIYEYVPQDPTTLPMTSPWTSLGSIIGRATTVTSASAAGFMGFSVFNQGHAMITTPQANVPAAGSGMTIPYVRIGSGARIAVACDPALASLYGASVAQQVSWDFNNQVLQPYFSSGSTETISSITTASTGVATVTMAGAISGWTIAVGDTVYISGVTANSGTAPFAAINGGQKVVSVTSGTVFTIQLPTNLGTWGTITLSSGAVNYSGGALPVKVLKISVGGSMVARFDPVNLWYYWDRSGSTAEILI